MELGLPVIPLNSQGLPKLKDRLLLLRVGLQAFSDCDTARMPRSSNQGRLQDRLEYLPFSLFLLF